MLGRVPGTPGCTRHGTDGESKVGTTPGRTSARDTVREKFESLTHERKGSTFVRRWYRRVTLRPEVSLQCTIPPEGTGGDPFGRRGDGVQWEYRRSFVNKDTL